MDKTVMNDERTTSGLWWCVRVYCGKAEFGALAEHLQRSGWDKIGKEENTCSKPIVQWHHIFPKSLLKEKSYETGEINEIANMAFITGQTNRRISNKEPRVYLREILAAQGPLALESQLVPTDPEMWTLENYRTFLSQRRDRLAALMNDFIARKANLKV